jgi:IS1 family transposase
MKKLSIEKRARIVASLVEGNSIRATSRMVDVSQNTVLKLLADLGEVCVEYHERHVRGVHSKRVQCDEIWAFNYCKKANIPERLKNDPTVGDVWTWAGLCADSKLIVSYRVGGRDAGYAWEFMHDLADRLSSRVQLTTDGHSPYLEAVEGAFGADIDYAMLIKLYGSVPEEEKRYSPPKCIGVRVETIQGDPDRGHISTSYVERQNLTMRMSMRRFTRLTNGFSKKFENHCHAVAIHFMHYNYCRIHRSLRITPAMAAEISDHVWSIEELVGILETKERADIESGALKRGPYNKKSAIL